MNYKFADLTLYDISSHSLNYPSHQRPRHSTELPALPNKLANYFDFKFIYE
jgi:hypothetical protein